MTKVKTQLHGAKTYRLAIHGNHAMKPLRNCPMLSLAKAESYASDMRLAGYDVLILNMGAV